MEQKYLARLMPVVGITHTEGKHGQEQENGRKNYLHKSASHD